jgi:cytochrome c peroxidase
LQKPGSLSYSVEPIQPIPFNCRIDHEAKVELGKTSYFTIQFYQRTIRLACAGCHDLGKGRSGSTCPDRSGLDKTEGEINAPTVFNSGFNFRQFWDGRAETLEDQIAGPLANSKEMNNSWEEVIQRLNEP